MSSLTELQGDSAVSSLSWDALPAAVCHIDAEYRLTAANRRFRDWFGVDSSFDLPVPITEALDPRNCRLFVRPIEDALSGGEGRLTLQAPASGQALDTLLDARFAPLGDPPGREGVQVAILLSEDGVASEDDLYETDRRYRELLTMTQDAILVRRGPEGEIVFVNPAGVRLLGADSEEEILGRPIREFVFPDDWPLVARRRDAAERGVRLQPVEFRWVTVGGGTVDVEVMASAVEWDREPAALIIARDISGRVRARTELQEERSRAEHLRRLVEDAIGSITEGFALFDAEDRLVLCNSVYTETIWPQLRDIAKPGVSFERLVREIARTEWQDDGRDAGEIESAVQIALQRHREVESSNTLARPDGRFIRQNKRATSDGGVVAVYSDVTDLIRREAQTREREERYRRLIELTPDTIRVTREGEIVFVNPAAARMFGASSPQEIIGRFTRDFRIPGEEAESEQRRAYVNGLDGPTPFTLEKRLRLDGREIDVDVASAPIMWEGDPAILTVMRDVTERLAAERKVRDAESREAMTAANLPGALFQRVRDAEGEVAFTYASAGLSDLLDLSPEQLLDDADSFFTRVDAPDRARVAEAFEKAGRASKPLEVEYSWTRGSGRRVWVRCIARAHSGDDGTTVWEGMLLDVTVRKDATLELTAAKEAAEAANHTKSEFLANMSHELRTPLNAIIGFSEVIMTELLGPLGTPSYRDYARDINGSGRHLLGVINDILDLSKIEAGQHALNETTVDLCQAIRECLKLAPRRNDAQPLPESIVVECPADLPAVRADDRKIRQILINLLSNSSKFTPSDGRIVVSARRQVGRGISVSVEDSGIGMSEDEVRIALSPFGQLEGSMARKFEGTGLGLPLSQSLIELHGGTLHVESKKGAGTKVTIAFPEERIIG